jgi:hypothetical protein
MLNSLLRISIYLLISVSVFDPADKLLKIKVPVFVFIWIIFLLEIVIKKKDIHYPQQLVFYFYLFSILFPLISICIYMFKDGNLENYFGFYYLKSYLFLTLVFILYARNINIIKPLSANITVLSLISIFFLLTVFNDPNIFNYWYAIGHKYGIFSLSQRTYGNISYNMVYFHTVPLSVVTVSYFTFKVRFTKGFYRLLFLILLLINIIGMIVGGSRNSIIMSIFIPILVLYWYSSNKKLILVFILIFLIIILNIFSAEIKDMIDVNSRSNKIKLGHIRDMFSILSNANTLLLGQGLGSYYFSIARQKNIYVIELTYLDIFRQYGLIMGLCYLIMFLFPLMKLRLNFNRERHYIFLAYIGYLIMSISNPFIFSSSGMLVLSIVLHAFFQKYSVEKSNI